MSKLIKMLLLISALSCGTVCIALGIAPSVAYFVSSESESTLPPEADSFEENNPDLSSNPDWMLSQDHTEAPTPTATHTPSTSSRASTST